MYAARPVVGHSLHHRHAERLFPAQKRAVDTEAEGRHENLRVLEGLPQRDIEGWRDDGVGVDEKKEVSFRDAGPSVHRRSAPSG